MRYEYERFAGIGYRTGDIDVVDTKKFDYESLWKKLGFTEKEAVGAEPAIKLFSSSDNRPELIITTSQSWMKPFDRDMARKSGAHYITREALEKVSGEAVVQALIAKEVIELHRKWWRPLRIDRHDEDGRILIDSTVHKRHPQAPYRINPNTLYYESFEEFCLKNTTKNAGVTSINYF